MIRSPRLLSYEGRWKPKQPTTRPWSNTAGNTCGMLSLRPDARGDSIWLKPTSEACPGRDSNYHQDFMSVTGLKKRPYGEIEQVSPSLTPAAPNDHWPQEGFHENTT